MEIWTIYKMEIIKTLKRKNSLILLIPSILIVIMAFGISTLLLPCGRFSTLWAFGEFY